MLRPLLSGLLCCGLTLAGCEQSTSSTTAGAHPAIERVFGAYCERRLECPGGRLSVYDYDTCMRAHALLVCERPKRLPDVSECEQAMRTMDCASVRRAWWAHGCESIMQAYVDSSVTQLTTSLSGNACASDIHCKAGMRCVGAAKDCVGTCAPLAEEGEPCSSWADCRDELVCSRDQICERPRPAGTLCRDRLECEQDCVHGVCVTTTELLGRPCFDQEEDCGGTLRCRDGSCQAPVGLHGDCDESCDCYPGLGCVEQRCVPTADCHAGERDDPCMDDRQCRRGLSCDKAERRCVPTPKRGERCSIDLLCGPGDACVIRDLKGVCEAAEAPKADGEPCSAFWECASGLCPNERCEQPIACE